MSASGRRKRFWLVLLELSLLILILLLAAYVRVANLRNNPGWYSDEGTHLDIAHHMQHGDTQYFAITQSMLLFGKLPAYPWIVSRLLLILDPHPADDITVLRLVSAVTGVLAVGLLYGFVRRAAQLDPLLALLAAFFLAIYPSAAAYNRLGFSYNMLAPLVLIVTWGLWEYLNVTPGGTPITGSITGPITGRLWLALVALAAGVGMITDLLMIYWLPPLALVVLARRWRDLLWSLPLIAVPLVLYAVWMLGTAPDAFGFDLRFTLDRAGVISFYTQIADLVLNPLDLMRLDFWFLAAAVGLFLLRPERLRWLVLACYWLPMFALNRTVDLSAFGFYYLIPFFPLAALGMAALVYRGTPAVLVTVSGGLHALFDGFTAWPHTPAWDWLRDRLVVLGTGVFIVLVIVSPFIHYVFQDIHDARTTFDTPVDNVLLDPYDARRAADFVNTTAAPGDVIIASPGLGWLLDGQVADFQMALAAEGRETEHLPADLPAGRFAFDPRYRAANLAVIDNVWQKWAAREMDDVAAMIADIESSWTPLFWAGDIIVYRNPAPLVRG
ncbi:MAG: hypothetical protein JW966_15585 [Anaerolineae bacterium]|nr:hypothetical protein [Anaerolineae bacterium]